MLNGFKKFIMQGNVVDLAVGIVIGIAFGKIVDVFVKGLVTPLIGVIMPDSAKDIATAHFTINGSAFMWGAVLSEMITFVATAAAVYFVIVMPMNMMKERRAAGQEADVEPTNDEKVLALLERIAAK